MLASSRFDLEGAGCFEIVLQGCWLVRDLILRVLAVSRNWSVLASTLRGCWLARDCNTRVLASLRFDFEGAG